LSNLFLIYKGLSIRVVVNSCLFFLVFYLSIPVVKNLISSRQAMNTSFEPFRIVNTYGAFGSITKQRNEVIFKGTHSDPKVDPNPKWLEYEFKCKPGDMYRAPCFISPYHYRLGKKKTTTTKFKPFKLIVFKKRFRLVNVVRCFPTNGVQSMAFKHERQISTQ
jgi:hypothetical protein